jgi:hypothetical protein
MGKLGLWWAGLALVVGAFWAGRESTHGLRGFADRWWCPVPLVLMALGAAALASRPLRRGGAGSLGR